MEEEGVFTQQEELERRSHILGQLPPSKRVLEYRRQFLPRRYKAMLPSLPTLCAAASGGPSLLGAALKEQQGSRCSPSVSAEDSISTPAQGPPLCCPTRSQELQPTHVFLPKPQPMKTASDEGKAAGSPFPPEKDMWKQLFPVRQKSPP